MNGIGVSLSFGLLSSEMNSPAQNLLRDKAGGLDPLLELLRGAGTDSIEMRAVGYREKPGKVLAAAEKIRGHGMRFTAHGALPADEAVSPEEFFSPYQQVFGLCGDRPLLITVHGLSAFWETAEALKQLCAYIASNRLPARIALENNRLKFQSRNFFSVSLTAAEQAVAAAARPELGICWDFGHYDYNIRFAADAPAGGTFLKKCLHTHIHALEEGSTHHPLSTGESDYKTHIGKLLSAGYGGIFNLELSPSRYYEKYDPLDSCLLSVRLLREAVENG